MARHDRQTLLAMAPEVEYEVAMVQLGRLFINAHHSGNPISQMTMNLVVESALVHLRNLDEFLGREPEDRGVRDNDMLATDYLAKWQPRSFLGLEKAIVSRYLAHITTDRVRKRDWPVVYMATQCDYLVREFKQLLKSEDAELAAAFSLPDESAPVA